MPMALRLNDIFRRQQDTAAPHIGVDVCRPGITVGNELCNFLSGLSWGNP